jgi:D-glycero-D-manno-heptose 1,7-bisphosphate phosphatase
VRPALVLLDRDGTINASPARSRYLVDVDEVRLLPGVAQAICRLNAAGVPVAVVTNQRGIATGALSPEAAAAVQGELVDQLARGGATVDSWHVCPHDDADCDCRKPRPGLLQAAMSLHHAAPGASAVIGDSESDMLAGKAVGALAVLLAVVPPASTVADAVQPDLATAVAWLLGELR